jgi:hypothetical protein
LARQHRHQPFTTHGTCRVDVQNGSGFSASTTPALDLLKDAGMDMTTSEPLDLTMKKMNRIMDDTP